MKKEKTDLAQRLAELRKSLKLTQGEFAEKISVSKPTLVRYEAGNGYPDARSLTKMIEFFNVNINWLLGGGGEMFNVPLSMDMDEDGFDEFHKDLEDLLFHLREVPLVRYSVLKHFVLYKHDNQDKIDSYLERKKKKKD